MEIAEEDLTPERSSKAVNRCIVDLSVGRRDVLDVVGCWGDVGVAMAEVLCFGISDLDLDSLLSHFDAFCVRFVDGTYEYEITQSLFPFRKQ